MGVPSIKLIIGNKEIIMDFYDDEIDFIDADDIEYEHDYEINTDEGVIADDLEIETNFVSKIIGSTHPADFVAAAGFFAEEQLMGEKYNDPPISGKEYKQTQGAIKNNYKNNGNKFCFNNFVEASKAGQSTQYIEQMKNYYNELYERFFGLSLERFYYYLMYKGLVVQSKDMFSFNNILSFKFFYTTAKDMELFDIEHVIQYLLSKNYDFKNHFN